METHPCFSNGSRIDERQTEQTRFIHKSGPKSQTGQTQKLNMMEDTRKLEQRQCGLEQREGVGLKYTGNKVQVKTLETKQEHTESKPIQSYFIYKAHLKRKPH